MTHQDYIQHPLRESANRVLAIIDDPKFSAPAVADVPQPAYARDKIFAIATRIAASFEKIPAPLGSIHALNQLNSLMHTVIAELQSYLANENISHILGAGALVDQQVQSWLWGFTEDDKEGLHSVLPKLFVQHANDAEAAISRLSTQRDDLQRKFDEQNQHSNELKRRLDEMTESASRERAEAAAAVAKLELAFNEKESERASKNAAALEALSGDYMAALNIARGTAANILQELDSKRVEAKKIVAVVGNIGATGNYQKIADSEAKQADIWRLVTVGLFFIAIAVAVTTFVRHWGEEITVPNALAIGIRLIYAIAITAPALYTARESARHRSNADRARQTELELASIGPFIELMPEDKKNSIREELTKRYFGQPIESHTIEPPIDAANVVQALTEFVKTIRK